MPFAWSLRADAVAAAGCHYAGLGLGFAAVLRHRLVGDRHRDLVRAGLSTAVAPGEEAPQSRSGVGGAARFGRGGVAVSAHHRVFGTPSFGRLPTHRFRRLRSPALPARLVRRTARLGHSAVGARRCDGLRRPAAPVDSSVGPGQPANRHPGVWHWPGHVWLCRQPGCHPVPGLLPVKRRHELAKAAATALPVPHQFKRELVVKFMAVVRATACRSLPRRGPNTDRCRQRQLRERATDGARHPVQPHPRFTIAETSAARR